MNYYSMEPKKKKPNKLLTFLMATDSYDIRRYLAILFSAGGSIIFTIMLAVLILLLSANAGFLFWIAMGLLILIGFHQTGFISLLVKRSIILSKDEIQIVDRQDGDKDSGLVRAPVDAPPPQVSPYEGDPYQTPYPTQPYNPLPYNPGRPQGFDLGYDPSNGSFNMGYQPPPKKEHP